jgi:phage portal protein BeeE
MLHHMTKTTSWGTGVEAIMLGFVRSNLKPWLDAWTQTIRRDLIIAPNIYEAKFDTEDLQRGDSKAQADFYSRLVLNGIITRNEARWALGYNPLEGLNDPLVPTNTTTTDNMPQNDPQPASEPGQGSALESDAGAAVADIAGIQEDDASAL